MNTINITPTWTGQIRSMLYLLENPDVQEKSKQVAREELLKMARAADLWNEECKRQKEAV